MAQGAGRLIDGSRGASRHAGRVIGCVAVIPAFEAGATLASTLESLAVDNADSVDRVIVVCSPASDHEQIRVASQYPDVVVIRSEQRLSAGAARNLGVDSAGCDDDLLFVDADCSLPRGAVARLLDVLRSDATLGCIGASIESVPPCSTTFVRHLLEFKDSEAGVPQVPDWMVPSATMLCRREAYERVGGFPDLWPGEDLVFCRTLDALGYRVLRSNSVVITHRHPPGIGRMLSHQYRLGASSARARLAVAMPGSAFARHPWLAPALFFGRLVRGLGWQIRRRSSGLPIFILLLPLYLVGLATWTIGFAIEAGAVWVSGDERGKHTSRTDPADARAERRHRPLEHT